jgi:3-deoxy-D-manno-octulosonate cytidylyltransferase
MNETCIVVPARMDSTRFPGKPLIDLLGKPMIQWVAEAAIASGVSNRVVVATPDQVIAEKCDELGIEVVMTRSDHPSGTDRIAEVATRIKADVYVNVQGDEPLIRPESIAACVSPLFTSSAVEMASVYTVCPSSEEENPAAVKVVTDQKGFALYFSRWPIPYPRTARPVSLKKHVGIYAFRGEVLARFAKWSQTPLEMAESLEQLRFIENGIRIAMSEVELNEVAVDTPEQAEEVRQILAARGLGL